MLTKIDNLTPIASPTLRKGRGAPLRRLIDNGLLHYEASIAGLSERYLRGETSHTIHVWWARRPHAAMRALVFASLCKDTSAKCYSLLRELCCRSGAAGEALSEARKLLSTQYKTPPRVLDMFGGGGTISFEGLNLGAKTSAIDANELSVFIQKCNLQYSQTLTNEELGQRVRESGDRVLERLQKETEMLFPLRRSSGNSPISYLWTYAIKCQGCGYKHYLSKRHFLSKKKDRNLTLRLNDKNEGQEISIEADSNSSSSSSWSGKGRGIKCPKCSLEREGVTIKDCTDELVAQISSRRGKGKDFTLAKSDASPSMEILQKAEENALKSLRATLPVSTLPAWSGIVNPTIYGMSTHADVFNPRQRAVLLLLIKALADEYELLLKSQPLPVANVVIGFLSSLIDQLVDWNCRLSMWIPQNEQSGRAFCGPGVAMLWDYVETDPVMAGPGNLKSKLNRIVAGSQSIGQFQERADVRHAYAQKLPFKNEEFDAIVTDPPYYDNIYYSVLADFFYAWKRILLEKVAPDLFLKRSSDSSHELVASSHRSGNAAAAHFDYCAQLRLAIQEAARVLKDDGVFSFVYAHSSINGWAAVVQAFRPTQFQITSVQPLSIERRHRPRAMTSEAVNTCLVFVAHKVTTKKSSGKLQDVLQRTRAVCTGEFTSGLGQAGWADNDAAMAAYAHGVAILANVQKIDEVSDSSALEQLEMVIRERFKDFRIQKRGSI